MVGNSSQSHRLMVVTAGLALLVAVDIAYTLSLGSKPRARGAGEATTTPAGDCRCDDARLRAEVGQLRSVVRELQRSVETSAVIGAAASGRSSGGDAEGSLSAAVPGPPQPTAEEFEAALPGDRPVPPIALFMGIPRGVHLVQADDGTVVAEASDPRFSGQEILVYARTKDGETTGVRVTVP